MYVCPSRTPTSEWRKSRPMRGRATLTTVPSRKTVADASTVANRRAKAGLTAAERKASLEEMSGLHRFVKDAAAGLSEAEWQHKTPVVYGEGQDPFPTSADDVVGWLRDHYREHVQQCPELIASWRAMS